MTRVRWCCPQCGAAVRKNARVCRECGHDVECWHAIALEQADMELDDVLEFLRRHERDQVLGITPPSLADIIEALQRGDHRR